jgi:hypothetical protein
VVTQKKDYIVSPPVDLLAIEKRRHVEELKILHFENKFVIVQKKIEGQRMSNRIAAKSMYLILSFSFPLSNISIS